MKNKSRQHHLLLTIVVCITLILGISFTASAAIRETDVSTASSGNIIVFVPGEFAKAEVSTILNLVNSYRKEACQKLAFGRSFYLLYNSSDFIQLHLTSINC